MIYTQTRYFIFAMSYQKAHRFYDCNNNNRYCIIEVLVQFCESDDKCGSNHIKIVREIAGKELQIAKGLTNGNTGLFNSDNQNSGDWNSGIFNKTNGCNGVFCNKEPTICIFNIPTDWTLREFINSKYYKAIISSDFSLTEWKQNAEPNENGVNGKLIVNTYEEACRRWWDGMTLENREIIKSIPNFDIDVFCDITGIDKDKV